MKGRLRADRRSLAVAAALVTFGCRSGERASPPPPPPSARIASIPLPPAPSVAVVTPLPPAASAAAPLASSSARAAKPRGSACAPSLGPVQLSFTGPITFVKSRDASGGAPLVVINRDGEPQSLPLPAQKGGKGERVALPQAPEKSTRPACATGGPWIFCADAQGAIHRTASPGSNAGPPKVVAQGRAGGSIAAAALGPSRVAYAFLADRKTSEGATTLAFMGVDDATPVLLSEEGSGATHVALAPRGDQVLATYVDARRVLTPVHARLVSATDTLRLERDAVVFVGAGGTSRMHTAFARGSGGFDHLLLPIDKDDKVFGMAAIRIDAEPRDDAETVWSPYPAATERAAIAVSDGPAPVSVLRTRPADATPKAKMVLELGRLDDAGRFQALCTVAEASSFSDLAVFVEASGAVWLAYTQGDATWVERRG